MRQRNIEGDRDCHEHRYCQVEHRNEFDERTQDQADRPYHEQEHDRRDAIFDEKGRELLWCLCVRQHDRQEGRHRDDGEDHRRGNCRSLQRLP